MEQTLKQERNKRIAQYLLDRLIQDLTIQLLPILETDNSVDVKLNLGTERSADCPIKLAVTQYVNYKK